jgi:ArsR family transcriptional regulator
MSPRDSTRDDMAEIVRLHARVCQALADPKRLLIINELRDGSRSVGQIAESLEISQPNCSQHLAVLKERGIVTAQRSGNTINYSLRGHQVLEALDLLRDFMVEHLEQRGSVLRQ